MVDEVKYVPAKIQRQKSVIDLVFSITENEGFICGGFARYCVSANEKPILPSDIDVFCKDGATFERILQRVKAHPDMVRKSSTQIETKYEYKIKSGFHKESYGIQLIKPAHIHNMVSEGDWGKVLDNFDFTIAKCAILPSGEAFVHPDFAAHDEQNKLIITNIHCPISSCKRVIKYCSRGYKIESSEILKLFNDFENRPADWKILIREGLSMKPDDENYDPDRHDKFISAMYFD